MFCNISWKNLNELLASPIKLRSIRLLQVFIITQMDELTLWESLMHLQGTLHEKASFRAALTVWSRLVCGHACVSINTWKRWWSHGHHWHPPMDGEAWWAAVHGVSKSRTERLHFHFSFPCTGEGNGNPLQCSCLENPRDGGAWWAAVYRVAQSQTRLKWLSSSSRTVAEGTWEMGVKGDSHIYIVCGVWVLQ